MSHLGVSNPPKKTPKMGVNRHFQTKQAKYQNGILSQLLHQSDQILHKDKDHQILLVRDPNTCVTNRRWRMAAILKNQYTAISQQWFDRSPRNLA